MSGFGVFRTPPNAVDAPRGRDGEPVAALLSPDEAAWCATLAARFRDRRPWMEVLAKRTESADRPAKP